MTRLFKFLEHVVVVFGGSRRYIFGVLSVGKVGILVFLVSVVQEEN